MATWRAGQRITASALQAISVTDPATYTPAVGNGGSATWTTRAGSYYILGDMVFVDIFLSASGVGSGSGIVTVDMPTNVDRTIRQTMVVHAESVKLTNASVPSPASTTRGGECVFFTSGTGATADRIRLDDSDGDGEGNLLGQDITATSLITIQGWYRKA